MMGKHEKDPPPDPLPPKPPNPDTPPEGEGKSNKA
jgi:hypothetical protein